MHAKLGMGLFAYGTDACTRLCGGDERGSQQQTPYELGTQSTLAQATLECGLSRKCSLGAAAAAAVCV